MKENEYTIENLKNVFLDHHKKFMEQQEKLKEKYPDNEYFLDDFSISLALHKICEELEQRKEE